MHSDESLTAIEPETQGNIIQGLGFHKCVQIKPHAMYSIYASVAADSIATEKPLALTHAANLSLSLLSNKNTQVLL